jgi:hypothetical protein
MMIAAAPNGGKSFLALWYAVANNLPTLYISADTDQATTLYRALAMITGDKVDDIEEAFEQGADDAYTPDLHRISNLRFTFDPTPTMDDINLEVQAFEEMWGKPPSVIVIDNLMNVVSGEGASGWQDMMEISQFLHHLARKSEAAVLILHHTSESEGKAAYPPPRKAVINKVSQLPEVILTVAMVPDEQVFRVACVKNRSGSHDPSGHNFTTLYVIPERMQLFTDPQSKNLFESRLEHV